MSKPKKTTNFSVAKATPDNPRDPIDRLCLHIQKHPVVNTQLPGDGQAMALAYTMLPDLVKSIRMLKAALEEAMPGVKHIACQDYEILNTAPCFANDTLFKIRTEWAKATK